MKQRLLILALSLFAISLSAQDTLFIEDFSEGFKNWTTNSTLTGNNTGDELGVWQLDQLTLGGNPFPLGVDLQFSFVNSKELAVQFSNDDDTSYGFIYSRYSFNADNLVTEIDGGALVADGVASGYDGNYPEWTANLNVDPATLSILATLVSANDITVAWDAMNNMTISVQGGASVFSFSKVADNASAWFWSPNGFALRSFTDVTVGEVIESETQDNGAAIINTVFQNFLADSDIADAILAAGPPYPEHRATLTSDPIDISSADKALELQFTTLVRVLNPSTGAPNDAEGEAGQTYIEFSVDGGTTWTTPEDPFNGFANNQNFQVENQKITIPGSLTEGQSSLLIRFTYGMDFHFWVLDDIIVRERVGVDMQANSNFFAIAPNYSTPVSQVTDMFWMADIQNNGGETAPDVNLNLTITGPAGEVYNADLPYGNIGSDSLAENVFFVDPLIADNLMTLGEYTGTYTVSTSAEDTDADNNQLEFTFEVTDTLFAKAEDWTRDVAPAAETFEDNIYHYGNAYYVPNGDGMYARYVTFGIANADELAGFNGTVSIYLYEWTGALDSEPFPADSENFNAFSPNTYGGQPLAFNSYTFDGTENDQLLTIPISVDEVGVPLQDGFYYVLVMHFVSTSDDERCFMLASEAHDYSAMAFITDSLMVPRHAGVLEVGDDSFAPTLSVVGFGRDIVPVMRMSIGNNPNLGEDPMVDVNNILPASYGMNVYPNPANEQFNLDLEMPGLEEWAQLTLYDVSGRIFFQERYDNIQRGEFQYNVNQLPAGNYFLRLATPNGSRTQKLTIQH